MLVAACLCTCAASHAADLIEGIDEINKALAAAKPGETVVIKNGVYRDAEIVIHASGEEGRLITLAAQTPGKVVFTGTSQILVTGSYVHVTGFAFQQVLRPMIIHFQQAKNCRLSHCAFNESGDPMSTFTKIVEIAEGSHDNEIDHCYFARSTCMSVGVRAGALRNKFHHNWWRDIVARHSNGQEALQLGGPVEKPLFPPLDWYLRSVVEDNLFDGACGDEEIISIKSKGNIIRRNTFLGHPTANKGGLVIRYSDDNLIEGNYFFNVVKGIRVEGTGNKIINNYIEGGRGGLLLVGGGVGGWAYKAAKGNLFAHNTIVNVTERAMNLGIFIGLTSTTQPSLTVNIYPSNNRFYNNLFISHKSPVVADREFGTPEQSNEYKQNLIDSAKVKEIGPVGEGLIPAKNVLVMQEDRFRPQPGGPADGQAVPLAEVTHDIEGRPRGAKPTIGCDELGAAPAEIANRRLTGKDVGPDWMAGDYTILDKQAGILELKDLLQRHPDPEYRQRLHHVLDSAK